MLIIGRPWIDFRRPPAPGWIRLDGRRIAAVGEGPPPAGPRSEDVIGDDAAVIVPGFTDAHLHLPQFHQRGVVAGDLLTWLDRTILPAEARWADAAWAASEAEACLEALLRAGTVRAAAFLSAHPSATDAARAAAARVPVDLLAGVSLMDRAAPDDMRQPEGRPPALPDDDDDAAAAADDDAEDRHVRGGDPPPRVRLRHSVNPRFAVSCTNAMLAAAGRQAPSGGGRFVQTHLAEQVAECRRVAELFPGDPSYTAVYARHGLLHDRTLLAHAIHLAEEEWGLIAAAGATIVHCPGANTFLASGLFDLTTARRHRVRVALGSDIAAGPDLSMPRVARAMIEVATLRRLTIDPGAVVPSPADAWRTITSINADAVGRPDAGRLAPGAAADLLLLHPDQPLDEHAAGRLLHAWDDGWISHRIIDGAHRTD